MTRGVAAWILAAIAERIERELEHRAGRYSYEDKMLDLQAQRSAA